MSSLNTPTEPGRPHILPLSARDPKALTALARRYAQTLSCPGTSSLRDVCYSAATGRTHHNHRLAVLGDSLETMVSRLNTFAEHGRTDGGCDGKLSTPTSGKTVFVFTGMGPQWWGMGAELFATEPVFKQTALTVEEGFRSIAGWSLLAEMQRDETSSRMNETQVAQPANFLLQVALAELLRSWGVVPAAVVGHSVGEVAAVYVAGGLDLPDAIHVIYHRSRLQQQATGKGRMLAIGLGVDDARALISRREHRVSIAAVNGGSSTTLSGCAAALGEIAARLDNQGSFNRFLHTEVPYHSVHMDPLKPALRQALGSIRPRQPGVPLYSSVTGQLVDHPAFDAEYWCDNVREPVLFADVVASMLADGYSSFLEVGPHPVLSASIKDSLRERDLRADVLACLRRGGSDGTTIRLAVAGLYVTGHDVDWRALSEAGARRVKVPSYPWQRERLWFEESVASLTDRLGRVDHPLLGLRIPGPTPEWELAPTSHSLAYLSDHVVENEIVFPGSGYVEQGLAIHALLDETHAAVVEDLEFLRPLVATAGRLPTIRTRCDERTREFTVQSHRDDDSEEWTLHARGRIVPAPPVSARRIPLDEIRKTCGEQVDKDQFYARLAEHGLRYGPSFQRIERIWRSDRCAVAELTPFTPTTEHGKDYRLHPAVLDAAIQSLVAAIDTNPAVPRPYVPASIHRVTWYGAPTDTLWSQVQILEQTHDGIEGNIVLCDDEGTVVAELLGVLCRPLPSANRGRAEWFNQRTYQQRWVPADRPVPSAPSGRWLVFSDEGGIGDQLTCDLAAHALAPRVEIVRRDAVAGVDCVVGEREDLQGVVYLGALDEADRNEDPTESRAALDFLSLVQALARRGGATPRLYVVTRSVQPIAGEDVVGVSQAAVIGLARTALMEHPELRCTVIDVDSSSRANVGAEIANELLCDSPETEVALRESGRYLCRLTRFALQPTAGDAKGEPTISAAEAGAFRLEIDTPGRLESLRFRQIRLEPPRRGEVQFRIHAAGLNFKDVLKATALLPSKAVERTYHGAGLGMEAAGIVSAVGEGVSNYRVGDAVVASVRDSFSSHVTVPADRLFAVRKRDADTFAESASVPVVFMTAYYALHELAHLQAGETVLIHAAAGGVGLAAIQVAHWLGATVIATCGSEPKRTYLRSLGVEHVLNSRTLEFADEVMALTKGRGVDVVLNSLSGEALLKTLSVVAPLGRFIEIGKRDIVENTRLPMMPFNRNLSFIAIDLDRIMAERPALIQRLLEAVLERFRAGDFTAIPIEVFPAAQIGEAFRRMAQSKQIGKIVISFEQLDGLSVVARKTPRALLNADASYLITGGCGGFGLEIATWMAEAGAKHVVLVGRSGARSSRAQATVRALEEQGIEVMVCRADIGDERQVVDCLSAISRRMPPLRGIMHAAGVIDDAILLNLDATRFAKVVAPKARGAWLLHKHTQHMDLELFVLFSSVAALVGNPGQGSYVAANVYLDALAHHRRARGLAATSINWGALAEAGMATDRVVAEHLARVGITPIRPRDAVAALSLALEHEATQVGFMEVDWQKWHQCHSATAALPKFADILEQKTPDANPAAQQFRSILLAAAPHERAEIAALALTDLIGETMRMSPDKIDAHRSLTEMGVDSLMALELNLAIEARLGVRCSFLDLQKGDGVLGLAQRIVARTGIAA